MDAWHGPQEVRTWTPRETVNGRAPHATTDPRRSAVRVDRAHEVQVRRHRLSRQAHGFEGLAVIPEVLVADDPPVSNRGDMSDLHARSESSTGRVPREP